MQERPVRIPGPAHPITIESADGLVRVRFNDTDIARSKNALALSEAGYPIVHYIPRDDVVSGCLKAGSKETYCPYKGDATHFDIDIGGQLLENAAWSYEDPFDAMAEISGHIAFYRDRVDIEVRNN